MFSAESESLSDCGSCSVCSTAVKVPGRVAVRRVFERLCGVGRCVVCENS